MKEFQGDLWDYYDQKEYWLVCTTNGHVKKSGECVMGAGIAKEVAKRFPEFPGRLGAEIRLTGNSVYIFPVQRIITFPVKHHWRENADLELIEKSAQELLNYFNGEHLIPFEGPYEDDETKVVCPRPGCGNGNLSWSIVKPVIEPYFDEIGEDLIAIIDRNG